MWFFDDDDDDDNDDDDDGDDEHKFPKLKCSKFLKVETAKLKCCEIKLFYSELSKC